MSDYKIKMTDDGEGTIFVDIDDADCFFLSGDNYGKYKESCTKEIIEQLGLKGEYEVIKTPTLLWFGGTCSEDEDWEIEDYLELEELGL